MNKLLILSVGLLMASGCLMGKNVSRLVPENKDADIDVFSIYGRVSIRSRVNPEGKNPLAPLPNPVTVQEVPSGSLLLTK